MNSDYVECPLNDTEVLAVCNEFVLVTNTDMDFAMKILQQNRWNLEHAVSAFFDLENSQPTTSVEQNDFHKSIDGEYQELDRNVETHFKLLSWNIDGLDEHSIEIRTQGVIDVIKR